MTAIGNDVQRWAENMIPPDMEQPVKRSLDAALLRAQAAVPGLEKTGRNDFHKYDYVPAEIIFRVAGQALQVGGVTAYRQSWTVERHDGFELPLLCSVMHVGCDGHSIHATTYWPIVVEKGRPPDKALATALTESYAYWLRDLLMIAKCGKEDEMNTRDDRGYLAGEATKAPTIPSKASVAMEATAGHPAAPKPASEHTFAGVGENLAEEKLSDKEYALMVAAEFTAWSGYRGRDAVRLAMGAFAEREGVVIEGKATREQYRMIRTSIANHVAAGRKFPDVVPTEV